MRTLTSTRRSAVVSVLAFLLVVAGAQAAHACSCLIGDPRDALHRSDGAFVGTLVERTEVDEQTSIFTFEVETAVKGTLGAEVDVRSASNGASCGMEVDFGQRIGLFLDTAEDGALDVRPVFADRPRRAATGGAAAPGARRRGAGPVRGRLQPGREPAVALDSQGRGRSRTASATATRGTSMSARARPGSRSGHVGRAARSWWCASCPRSTWCGRSRSPRRVGRGSRTPSA